jgi:hypothetical protein
MRFGASAGRIATPHPRRRHRVVEVHGRCGEILFAEQCPTDQQATRLANQIGAKLNGNRQQTLFA